MKKKNHHVPQSLQMRNGYRWPVNTNKSCLPKDLLSEYNYIDPNFTYPVLSRPRSVPIEPQFVKYDKQCLTYLATFLETVALYPEEMNKRRQVKILYFLEDDTIAVMEGKEKVVRRGRHLKAPDSHYHWKDFNIGKEIKLNGLRLQIFGCDSFTKQFMASKGIVESEDLLSQMAIAPVVAANVTTTTTEQEAVAAAAVEGKADKLRRFLDFHGQVLCFDCQMENKDCFQKQSLAFKLYYYLEDGAITIKELKENQEGRHKFPFYLRRTRIPKSTGNASSANAFIQAGDLKVGEIVNVFGTRFLLTDCDGFTRDYFSKTLRHPQPMKLPVNATAEAQKPPEAMRPIPKYYGLGTPEDSLSSTLSLRPRTPKLPMRLNDEVLRYTCRLESGTKEDQDRRFILQFNVKNGTITITETPIDNSGIVQGRVVTSQRVPKPNTNPDLPEFYSFSDLALGHVILINGRRFRITHADKSVFQFIQRYPEKFTAQQVQESQRFTCEDHCDTLK